MRLLLTSILVLLPLTALAEMAGSLPERVSDQKDATTPTEPADAQTADELETIVEELWPYGNPYYSPASSINFEALPAVSRYDQSWLSPSQYEPEWLSDPFGRYGSLYSPDPMTNRDGVGNPYSPDSAMNLYSQGWRMEAR